jgi:hypothetical protein
LGVKIPSKITAGDSISWVDDPSTDNLGNAIAPPDWVLKYDFRQTDVTLSLTASVVGGQWRTSISAVQSATFAAGVAFWQAYATNGSSRVTLGSGQVQFLPNLAASDSDFDGRSQVEKDLEAVQAAMRSMISGGAVAEYTIGGRSLKKISMADLIMLEEKLKREVSRQRKAERIANGLGNPDNVFVRFGK